MKLKVNGFQESWNDFKLILKSIKKLQSNVQHLQVANKKLTKVQDALQRSVKRYQFKNSAHLAKLDQIINKR